MDRPSGPAEWRRRLVWPHVPVQSQRPWPVGRAERFVSRRCVVHSSPFRVQHGDQLIRVHIGQANLSVRQNQRHARRCDPDVKVIDGRESSDSSFVIPLVPIAHKRPYLFASLIDLGASIFACNPSSSSIMIPLPSGDTSSRTRCDHQRTCHRGHISHTSRPASTTDGGPSSTSTRVSIQPTKA